MKVFLEYARAVGPVLSVFICFLYCCQNAAAIGANIWLSDWANDAGLPLNVTQAYVPVRVGVYAALGIAQGETAPRVRISSDPLLGRVDPVRRSLQDRDAWQETVHFQLLVYRTSNLGLGVGEWFYYFTFKLNVC